jgi:hypothetical protein
MSEPAAAAAQALAERVRSACRVRFEAAYEEAGVAGLCIEGRLEFALDAVYRLRIGELLAEPQPAGGPAASQ